MKSGVKKAKKKPKKKSRKLSLYQKDADEVFNRWIRSRDSEDGFFTCISCKEVKPVTMTNSKGNEITVMNAGHYVAKKNCLHLRYNEFNTNGQCQNCNLFNDGNIIGYREGLIEKVGVEKVLELEQARHNTEKFTSLDYLDIIEKYKLKL
jgi:hypothetical protein